MEIELLKDIGAIVGAILSCITLATLIIKPLRTKFINWIANIADKPATAATLAEIKAEMSEMKKHLAENTKERREQIKEIKDQIDDIVSFDKKNHEALKDMIRERIVSVYYANLENKSLHYEEWETVCELANSYFSLGGNHFISNLMEQMKQWTIIR